MTEENYNTEFCLMGGRLIMEKTGDKKVSTEQEKCPFCGKKYEIVSYVNDKPQLVKCVNNHCTLGYRTVPLKDWNTRPIEDDLRRQLAEKDAKLKEWRRVLVDVKQIALNMSIGANFSGYMIKILEESVR